MNFSRPFIQRPIATVLLTIGLALAGVVAFLMLPVSRLPEVNFPVISVRADMPGASPADMARSVAAPLERVLGTVSGVAEMTSQSRSGSTEVILRFDMRRDVDSAAREVQAAVNAARIDLPADLRSNPTLRKFNPAGRPFMILALSSTTRPLGEVYDLVNNVLTQQLMQIPGVGDVTIGGSSLPAVRVAINPLALDALGISGEDVRAAIQANNASRPKGVIELGGVDAGRALQVLTPAPGLRAADYRDVVVAMRSGSEVRLKDVATVTDSVQDTRARGMFNGDQAVVVRIAQEPGANLIQTADAIDALLPQLRAQLPSDIRLEKAIDQTGSVRASVFEVEVALVVAVLLVIVVVGLFLRSLRAALIPAVATVVSLLGTFGVMYFLGYSLNNLSLTALTVATGFVVDDAIVVMENIARRIEGGMPRQQAALRGAREVGFTVLTMSVSLVAVFLPLLVQGDVIGAFFREFALTLSAAVMISLLVSLTTTPMMCAFLLPRAHTEKATPVRQSAAGWLRQRIANALAGGQRGLERGYLRALDAALAAPWLVVAVLAVVVVLNGYLFVSIPKGFFPRQDSGQLRGGLSADRGTSSTQMADKLQQAVDIIRSDPAVATVVGYSGRGSGGFLQGTLKPRGERDATTQQVVDRLRPKLGTITGLRIFLSPDQEFPSGGGARSTNSNYQFTLKADSEDDLKIWSERLAGALRADDRLVDVDDDRGSETMESYLQVDRDKATELGVTARTLNSALYNAFGQRQVATMYSDLNQYAVVMEWAQEFAQSPVALKDVRVPSRRTASSTLFDDDDDDTSANPGLRNASTGSPVSTERRTMVPLSAFASLTERLAPYSVRHDGGELSTTLSFNLPEGVSLAQGRAAVLEAVDTIGLPNKVRGAFSGDAADAQKQEGQQLWLIVAAIGVIYLVLGMLYESLIHPITVLTTLPSAGFGAFLALLALKMEFSIMALIGIFLLIGLVKKNAILIIDFALDAQRARGLAAAQAVREACLLRLRPILMTTLAAMLGALPLAIGFGEGTELRRPLGVTIIGGLLACQLLTLLTTPVVYVLLDKLSRRRVSQAHLSRGVAVGAS
ncbi:efflux RND transporter permease subunit [Ottowia sp.]|uniref:efflux RND transporter permease subunit n=1 Tax=Ottowia sp. TaxID=1898956 RepID=UPI003A83BE29